MSQPTGSSTQMTKPPFGGGVAEVPGWKVASHRLGHLTDLPGVVTLALTQMMLEGPIAEELQKSPGPVNGRTQVGKQLQLVQPGHIARPRQNPTHSVARGQRFGERGTEQYPVVAVKGARRVGAVGGVTEVAEDIVF